MSTRVPRHKVITTLVALLMATVWPATFFGMPFLLIGLVVIWFPNHWLVNLWLARGLPVADSPSFALAVIGWLFIVVMPVLMWYLMPQ